MAFEAQTEAIDRQIILSPKKLEQRQSSLIMPKDDISSKVDSIIVEKQLSKSFDSTREDPKFLLAMKEVCALRDDTSQISTLSEGSSTKSKEGEEDLLIVHEFNRVERLEGKGVHQNFEFWDSVDAITVEKYMFSLLTSPGKKRAYMPIAPFLTEEKRCNPRSSV